MFNLLTKSNFAFASALAHRLKNPYLSLTPAQLQPIIITKLTQPINSIGDINSLIYLGQASANKKMPNQHNKLIQKCIKQLDTVHKQINQYKQQQLSQLQYGELINMINDSNEIINQKTTQKIISMYVNTYSHIVNFVKQLIIYQNSCNYHNLDLIKQVAYHNIQNIKKNRRLSLSQYIAWLRIFIYQLTHKNIDHQLQQFLAFPNLCQISQLQKLTLAYLIISNKANWKIIEQLKIMPNLVISQNQIPKMACLKCQIMKYLQKQINGLSHLNMQNWDYNHLIWISQFVTQNDTKLQQKLHIKLMNSQLPKLVQPSTIFTYVNHIKLSPQHHIEISHWLCQQSKINSQCQESLTHMLIEINDKKLGIFYQQFYKFVLKLSLGAFKWENQNIVYYFGIIWKINDQNMEYLRRYILNTYASLGTARREIPTTSYFYKILQVTNVQKFYGNL